MQPMLFTLQKVIWFLIMPPASLILLMLLGTVISRKRRKTGKALILAATFLLYFLSLSPVADFLLRPLENAVPPLKVVTVSADAVVVPGGGSVDRSWIGLGPVPNSETLTRLVMGVELAKKGKIPLVLCGGNGEPFATTLNDADCMAEAAYAMGLARSRVIVENRSRNTLENAREVRKILQRKQIILATSAYYMRRAVAMFTRQGFTVIPAPTFYLVQTRKAAPALLIPNASNLAHSSVAIAEWLSLAWWKLRGEI
jgi:uncharacterized SAM-binding protein YcdF (DUF218 family)